MDHSSDHELSLELLARAIQQSWVHLPSIETYLQRYDTATVQSKLRSAIKGDSAGIYFPILFFAVARNSPQLVSWLCKAGADPKGKAMPSGLPVLAFAVISAEYDLFDYTETFIALLAAGANPRDIPKDMWEHYVEVPKTTEPTEDGQSVQVKTKDKWCTLEIRRALCRSLTLLQRYCLWRAEHLQKTTEVTNQVAEVFDIRGLFHIPYYIVAQLPAIRQVIDNITSHLLMNSDRPLVLLFTGMSGHGKTELACRMGHLLSRDTTQVDCAEMRHETDLFGPKFPYQGYQKGSPLNNFLVEHTGLSSVVFLDEFDKTTDEVRKALLQVLDSGLYRSRIDNKRLDCSKTIWILATNLGEDEIQIFWDSHLHDLTEDRQLAAPFHILQAKLKRKFIEEFGAPITGRISSIVPFLPFTPNEQAVIAYTFMRKLRNEVRKPIDVERKKIAQHLHLNFVDDGKIAKHLASESYIPELGARSLRNEVDQKIGRKLGLELCKSEKRIQDKMNEKPLLRYEFRLAEMGEGINEVEVKKPNLMTLQIRDED